MNQKSIVSIAVFGTLWGIIEATLGSALHLFKLPFSGTILVSIALIIILVARIYNPTIGSTFLMGLVAATIKVISISTVKLGPFIAIIIEGALIEIILTVFSTKRLGFILSAFVMAIYPITQTIITKTILFGSNFVPVILELAQGFSEDVGFNAGWWVLGIYLFAQVFLPFSAAYFTWRLRKRLFPDTS